MNHKPFTHETDIDERARRLSACYRFILSWPDPLEEKAKPVTDDLDEGAVAGSQGLLIHPDYLKASDDPDEIEQNI
jgi:hypothetical protein